jgi:hypothetical protein
MFGSTVLEVAIGLVFCYASVALIVSSINEGIASALKLRSKSLLTGIKDLLNDRGFQGLARDVYNHALVNPIDPGTAVTEQQLKNKPAYVEPRQFALALIDTVQTVPGNFAQLGNDIGNIADPQLRQLLQGMYARADGNLENLRDAVAAWFDTSMDRVSGAYKRQSQLICFLLGFVIAGLFNIDSFHLFHSLWLHPALTEELSRLPAGTDVTSAVARLEALPIGWKGPLTPGIDSLIVVVGWLVTASSALFGAPFWFDLLQRLIQLRGTGAKPGERK